MIPLDEYSSSHEILADIMTVVVIIFLVLVLLLALSAGSKLAVETSDNTFTGGNQRTILFVNSAMYTNSAGKSNLSFAHMDLNSFIGGQGQSFQDETLPFPEGILIFIEPGEARYQDSKYSAIQIVHENPNIERTINIIDIDGQNYQGKPDSDAFWSLITSVWGHTKDYFSTTLPPSAKITDRANVYYESVSGETNQIVVGHHTITINEELLSDPSFALLQRLATSTVDFVYLGEFSADKRYDFFRRHYGDGAEAWYRSWQQGEVDTPPFIKYADAPTKYAEIFSKLSDAPPEWVRRSFLSPLGVSQKIIRL